MVVVDTFEAIPRALSYPVMAIGVFDGVHRGHQEILKGLRQRADDKGGTALVLSFDPHPQKVIRPSEAPLLLQTDEQKEELLRRLGVDFLIRLPFTRRLSLYSPEQFARRILFSHGIREIRVGGNFRFGHRRSGDFLTLQHLGRSLGFDVVEVCPILTRGFRISSTLIRRALIAGRTSLARHLLGRPYQIRGMVVRGEGRGVQLGFPTANLHTDNELLPAGGVYVCHARVDGRRREAVTNIGVRPTVDPGAARSVVETHILDYHGDLYGKPIEIDFWLRLRDEKKFEGLDQLRAQIQKDIGIARRYFARLALGVRVTGGDRTRAYRRQISGLRED